MKITQYTVFNRLATSAIILALTVLGFYGLWQLPVNLLPDIEYPEVAVQIWWRGATPDEIDKNVADVIEREMATLDRLDSLESSAIDGMYDLRISFEYGADVDVAYQDVLASMARARRHLPPDIEEPLVWKADPSQLPVMQLAAGSNQWDLIELREWSEQWLNDQLVAVRGVAGVDIVGGQQREIRVLVDPGALEKRGIPLDTVLNRIEEENLDQFAGRITAERKEIIARTTGEFQSLDDIRSVVVARDGQAKVALGDVATVEDSHEEVRVNTRLDGEPCVYLSIFKQADANTVEVADGVRAKLDELREELPGDVGLSVVEDQAVYVRDAINSVRNAALQAAVLLVLVVYLFLGSFRQVLVMLLALPLTVVFNFGLMNLAGFSLNIFSLGGLVVALGVVLDNAIVVVETITRRRNAHPEAPASDHAIEGTREIGSAIVAATLSFVALFMPFLLVPGLTSLMFRELILVMAGIVTISLLLAVTLVPMFTAALLGKAAKRDASRFETFFMRVTERYAQLLDRVLRVRTAVLAAFMVLLIGAILLAGRLEGEFLPQMDDGRLMIRVELPTGASVAETDRLLRRVEKRIQDDPMIESRFALSGGRIRGLYVREMASEGELNIQLIPRAERGISTQQYIAQLRPTVMQAEMPGSRVMVSPQRVRGVRGRAQADIELQVRGAEMDTLLRLADEAAGTMNNIESFANVDITTDVSKPEYHVRVDRARAAELDVSVAKVANGLRSLITGAVPTRYLDEGEYYDIRILVPENEMGSHLDVENLPIASAKGDLVRVRDVARVERATGPVEILREDQAKQVVVQADIRGGGSVAQAQAQLESELAAIDLPTGYGISFGGEGALMKDLRQAVFAVLAFAVFFAFIVLAVQFNSLKLPALILGSVPFSLAGAILLLYLTGVPFGATVIIGILVVIAATVNDGVLLMLFAEQIQKLESKTPHQAVRDAARIRLRPRLMITMTSMAAFIPLAINWGGGAEMLQPMAVAAIGGLSLEILVALFLMPCIYVLFNKHT